MEFQPTDKDKPLSTTLAKQLVIYLVSFLLPPLGLWPGINYLRQQDRTAKKIGLAAIFLTILSIVITSWLFINFMNTFTSGLNNELDFYNELNY